MSLFITFQNHPFKFRSNTFKTFRTHQNLFKYSQIQQLPPFPSSPSKFLQLKLAHPSIHVSKKPYPNILHRKRKTFLFRLFRQTSNIKNSPDSSSGKFAIEKLKLATFIKFSAIIPCAQRVVGMETSEQKQKDAEKSTLERKARQENLNSCE